MFKVGEMTHKSQVETLQPPGFPDLDAQRVHFARQQVTRKIMGMKCMFAKTKLKTSILHRILRWKKWLQWLHRLDESTWIQNYQSDPNGTDQFKLFATYAPQKKKKTEVETSFWHSFFLGADQCFYHLSHQLFVLENCLKCFNKWL